MALVFQFYDQHLGDPRVFLLYQRLLYRQKVKDVCPQTNLVAWIPLVPETEKIKVLEYIRNQELKSRERTILLRK